MDSLSQVVLGATVAGIAAPAGHRRRALLMGAALGTLPDLDVFIDYGDAVKNFTYPRGFSHSLFVLAPVSLLLWVLLKRFWPPARDAAIRWLAVISLALLTHPLLDAHTAYGTQLFWPLTLPPTAWATIFIIDPLYTLPLLIGVLVVSIWPEKDWCLLTMRAGMALSTLYLGWTWLAQSHVERGARETIATLNISGAEIFATPTPLNSLLWRVVVKNGDRILEGFDSLLLDEGPIRFSAIETNADAIRNANHVWAVHRLRWFAQDLIAANIVNDKLIISDLRMGQNPNFVFTHEAAIRGNPQWTEIETKRLPVSFTDRALLQTWQRIWRDQTKLSN